MFLSNTPSLILPALMRSRPSRDFRMDTKVGHVKHKSHHDEFKHKSMESFCNILNSFSDRDRWPFSPGFLVE